MIDWTVIQANYDWLGHIVEGIVMAFLVALLARLLFSWRLALIVGLAFSIGHFHGREKRDYEVSVAMPPPQLDAYFMWRWNFDQSTDFWPVALVLAGGLLWLRPRRQAGKRSPRPQD